jgi:hypothetical protein
MGGKGDSGDLVMLPSGSVRVWILKAIVKKKVIHIGKNAGKILSHLAVLMRTCKIAAFHCESSRRQILDLKICKRF